MKMTKYLHRDCFNAHHIKDVVGQFPIPFVKLISNYNPDTLTIDMLLSILDSLIQNHYTLENEIAVGDEFILWITFSNQKDYDLFRLIYG